MSLQSKDIATHKKELKKQSRVYQDKIEFQVKDGVKQVKKWGTILLVGGTIGVIVYQLLNSGENKKKGKAKSSGQLPAVVNPQRESKIVGLVKEQIGVFLLSLAAQKLKEFLSNLGNEKPGTQDTAGKEEIRD